ncbi:hypothetical protein HanRHA438_Chr08g0340991 [Helianthus annuus]|nr:hypothetical protein HanRHA438_Chr08g0340991 [Helianthus annuus]
MTLMVGGGMGFSVTTFIGDGSFSDNFFAFQLLYSSLITTASGKKRRKTTTAALPTYSPRAKWAVFSTIMIIIKNPARPSDM